MRVVRRLVHVLVIVLTLVVGAAAAAIIVSQTAWFKDWLRGFIVREANQYLNGNLTIERLGGNLFFGIEMEDVGISMDGAEVVAVKDLGIDYNIFSLIARGLAVDEIRINQPVLYLRRDGDAWSIARLIKRQEQEADREGPTSPFGVDAIGISDASIVIDEPVGTSGVDVPDRIDRLDAELSIKYEPVHYSIEVSHVSFRASEPSLALNALSGGIAVRDDAIHVEEMALRTAESSVLIDGVVQSYLTQPVLNLRVTSDKLSLPEIALVVPALTGVDLQPAFEVRAEGPLDALGIEMNVRSSAGHLQGSLRADVLEPQQAVSGSVSVRHLNLAPLLQDASQQSDLTADVQADLSAVRFTALESLNGSISIEAPRLVASGIVAERVSATARLDGRRAEIDGRAHAYGATLTTSGRVTIPGETPLRYDLRGSVRSLDLRNLPADLRGAEQVPRAATNVDATYHVTGAEGRRRTVAGEVRFDDSTIAGARVTAGSTAAITVDGEEIGYEADLSVADLNLQQIGREFDVPALTADRYAGTLNGHVTAHGRGTDPHTMTIDASGSLVQSTILGGQLPNVTFSAHLADGDAAVKAQGEFAEFDPAVLTNRAEAKGTISGRVEVDATLGDVASGVTPDSAAGTVHLTLAPSTIGGLSIERGIVDADYHDRTGDIRQLEIVGRDLNVSAAGRLALHDTGQSDLKVHADSPSLEEIGRIIDRPLAGIARVDATVGGNRTELTASGTLTGSGVKYGENGALTIDTTFEARVPELTFEKAVVTAATEATFVTVAGQNLNEVKAKTEYSGTQLSFDATARQPERTLDVAGALTIHADHQEVHFDRLGLDAAAVQWQLEPGSTSTVNYAADRIAVRDLRLVSGDQRITADGTFGGSGEGLKVTLSNVDLASVDAMLLREPQLSGRLDATATIAGPRQAPEVRGEFEVNQGGFRAFKYDRLGGTVSYADRTIAVDSRLQQNAAQWITAKGTLPMGLFSSGDGESRPDANAPVDFAIDSSPIDLGLVQGFTTQLTDVTGTLEAHVRVTGTVDAPQPDGLVTVQKGAMTVAATGVEYNNVAADIQLLPDRIRIEQVTVLDNHYSPLSITGDLAVDARRVKGMELWVNATDFKIVDNELGEVRIESAMEVLGDLRAPRIGGYLGVNTGRLDLDRVIALAGPSAYATTELEFDTAGQKPAPGLFNALTMDVNLIIPNDLVVSADDLQPPGSDLSLGALNVTLGGDVQLRKEPAGFVHIVGPITTIRGTYDFQGRQFEILRDGSVRFEGLDEINPRLDIRTRRIIQAVEARVNIRGRLKEPEIVLSSTPPLEEADILSLIVFNQPINQLGEGQQISLAQRAQSLATGAVAGQLAESIGNALDLDTFEIDLAPESGSAAEFTVGQQLGQDLYVRVEQGVGDQTTTSFILEYELTDWLRLQTNVVEGSSIQQSLFRRAQGSGADLIFFFSF